MTQRTIGRLAKEVGVNVETVRYYERLGLIEKPQTTVGTKWRVYQDRALWALRYVKLAQQMGFSLAEISDLLGAKSREPPEFCRGIRAAVSGKLAQVEAELEVLQLRRQSLIDFMHACAKRAGGPQCPIFLNLRKKESR